MNRITCLLLATLSLATPILAQPPAPTQSEAPGAVVPGANVNADNSAVLVLNMGEKPQEFVFEEVKYASNGSPQSEEDSRYMADGKLAGRIKSLFDASGRLSAQEFTDGAGKRIAGVVAIKGKAGAIVLAKYDVAATPVLSTKPRLSHLKAGAVLLATYLYDKSGRLSSSRHPISTGIKGATIEYFYSPKGLPTRKVLRLPQSVTAVGLYNAKGKRLSQKITKPSKVSLNVSYSYNPRGNLQQVRMQSPKMGEAEPINAVADFKYDGAGRIREQTMRDNSELVFRTVFDRDVAGKPMGNTAYAYRGGKVTQSFTMRELDKETTEYSDFDAEGKLIERKVFVFGSKGRPARLQRQQQVRADGFSLVTTFDEVGKITSETYLDPNGKVVGTPGAEEPRIKPMN